MKKIYYLLFVTAILLSAGSGFGQKAKDYRDADAILISKKVLENPSIVTQVDAYEQQMKQLINKIKNNELNLKSDTFINGKRVIPVVFHVIHTYGPENISDAQIFDAVEKMNIDYQKLNADTADTYGPYQSRAANIGLEFRLAKIDPNGNCTNGIERVYDTRTDYAYYSVMHDYCWTPSHYLNIFAVDFIYPEGMVLPEGAFIGGMSPFPPSNPMTSLLTGGDTLINGVLIRQDCIGSIGTAENMGGMGINAMNRTLTHEAGHYWNLYHPFQNLMSESLPLPAPSGCYSFLYPNGDYVDDTPWEGSAAQNTSVQCFVPGTRNSCTNDTPDEMDMVENYMDYQWGYCANLFTLGQKERIDATLLGDRLSLWSKENLIATGVLDANPPLCAPVADFNVNYKMICAGSNVIYTDFSSNGAADSWLWTFPGGTPATSTDQNPTVTYDTPGTYSATLEVTNATGSNTLTKTDYIIVGDPDQAQDAPYTEGFETNVDNWYNFNMDGNPWAVTDSASFTGANSLWISNFSNNYPNSTDEIIIMPTIDFSALTPAPTLLQMKFQLAYTGKLTTNALTSETDTTWDYLKVYVSNDCGKTWQLRYSKTGLTLATAALTDARFFPTSTDWREEIVNLTPFISSSNAMIKFYFSCGGGNNIFIDDINITAPVVGIEEQAEAIGLSVYPNPMNETTVVSFDLPSSENVKIETLDLLGKQIAVVCNDVYNAGAQKITLSKNQFGTAGFYFIRMTVGNNVLMQKLAIQ